MILDFNQNRSIMAVAVAGMLIMSACSSQTKHQTNPSADTAIMVTLEKPMANNQEALNISGQVEAVQSANISTKIMGVINTINVKVGDHVKKSQVLATISNDDIVAKKAQAAAQVTEATAALQNAQKDFDRYTILYHQQSASAKELENVTLQFVSAKSRLEQAHQMVNEVNSMLSYTKLTAPFAGTITQKLAEAGSMANPGSPILAVEGSGNYQVSASVPEYEISNLSNGQKVKLLVSAINKILEGTVTQISRSSQFTGGQYLIKIAIAEKQQGGLFGGMYTNIAVPVKKQIQTNSENDHIMVPLSAIQNKDELTGLFTLGNNNTALLRWVRLGKTEGTMVEVLSGLAPDEKFIIAANGPLYNGIAVKVR